MPLIQALGRVRPEDHRELEGSLYYIVHSRPV